MEEIYKLLGLFVCIIILYNIMKSMLYKESMYNKYIDIIFELPGTIIHELSHLIMSIILMSKITGFSIIPKIDGDKITYGYVEQIPKFQVNNVFISIAPLIFNIPLMMIIVYYFNIEISYFLLEMDNLTIENVLKSYIFMIIITSSILSSVDVIGAIKGFISISGVVFLGIISYIGYYTRVDKIIIEKIEEISEKKIIFEINEIMINVIILLIGVIIILGIKRVILKK